MKIIKVLFLLSVAASVVVGVQNRLFSMKTDDLEQEQFFALENFKKQEERRREEEKLRYLVESIKKPVSTPKENSNQNRFIEKEGILLYFE